MFSHQKYDLTERIRMLAIKKPDSFSHLHDDIIFAIKNLGKKVEPLSQHQKDSKRNHNFLERGDEIELHQ
jgi:hypothetical protein